MTASKPLIPAYWHRPLAAFLSPAPGQAAMLPDAPSGFLTARPAGAPGAEPAVELWPRRPDRESYRYVIEGYRELHGHPAHQAAMNVRKLMDTWRLMGRRPLPRSWWGSGSDGWLRPISPGPTRPPGSSRPAAGSR